MRHRKLGPRLKPGSGTGRLKPASAIYVIPVETDRLQPVSSRPRLQPGAKRGFALLTAIWVLAVLMILVSGFAAMTHTETEVARNFGGQTRARWAARAGVRRAEAEVLTNAAAQPYTALGGPQETITGPDDTSSLAGASYSIALQDEAGKININTANAATLGAFFTADIVDNIIAWRTPNATTMGVGDGYYAGLSPPYQCKHAPFGSVEELLLVQGVTPDMLAATVTSNGLTLEDVLTVSSYDTNMDMTGQARLNLNSATASSLLRRCGDVFNSTEISRIIAQRPRRGFQSPADLLGVTGLRNPKQQVAKVYDRLTTSTARMLPGLVNLNTASAEVLGALPGMDPVTAQLIVQNYQTQGTPLTDVGQLLLMTGMTPALFRSTAALFTVRSTFFRAVATGQSADGMTQTVSSLLHVEQNAGTTIIRTLYWRE